MDGPSNTASASAIAAVADPAVAAESPAARGDDEKTTGSVIQPANSPQSSTECAFCGASFPSRNALFHHLRTSASCSVWSTTLQDTGGAAVATYRAALLVGYDVEPPPPPPPNAPPPPGGGGGEGASFTSAEAVGDAVRDAFQHALRTKYHRPKDEEGDAPQHPPQRPIAPTTPSSSSSSGDADDALPAVRVASSSQSTVSKLRHRCLGQEAEICSAAGDVMVLKYTAPPTALASTSAQRREEIHKKHLDDLIRVANRYLRSNRPSQESSRNGDVIRIVSSIVLPSTSRLHAERSCTQRAYHYLLPLKWLPGGIETGEWWLENQRLMEKKEREKAEDGAVAGEEYNQSTTTARRRKPVVGRFGITEGEHRARVPPPQPTLRLIKNALKQAESAKLSTEDIQNLQRCNVDRRKVAAGRFGALAAKERRCWHNYAAPSLAGEASPNNEPVWKVLDRAKIVQFMSYDDDDDDTQQRRRSNDDTTNDNATGGGKGSNDANGDKEVLAIVEFRGDDFVQEQVRRIVGAAVAVSHGWLPETFFDVTLSPDVALETPLAPPGRCYLAGTRFHFDELCNHGRGLFEDDNDDEDENAPSSSGMVSFATDLRDRMIHRRSAVDVQSEEEKWLEELRHVVAPRLRTQLEEMKQRDAIRRQQQQGSRLDATAYDGSLLRRSGGGSSDDGESVVPAEYECSLNLLRDISSSGRWPKTSAARSRVIRDATTTPGGGSFTVINPNFQGGILVDPKRNFTLPLGNELFPELAEAVFDMEEALSIQQFTSSSDENATRLVHQSQLRPASSHCAINCNAEFTPHVDSGRGAGQSLSMIVGLGDYAGGEIVIEGTPHDIRYKPLEFDGWKQRHWTLPFRGQRFSLVWFTPEMKGKK